jgi:gamma-glutamyltranspeptidase/glutathione hydrolase
VHPKVAWDWKRLEAKLRKNGTDHSCPGGSAPKPGDIFVQPALAETLRAIARHGAKAFYEGPIAADMVATLRARGGLHTEEDFALGLTTPTSSSRSRSNGTATTSISARPTARACLVLMILGMLEGLGDAPDGPLGTIRMHRHIEAARLAYRDRDAFVADMSQVDVPVAKLLSRDYLDACAA